MRNPFRTALAIGAYSPAPSPIPNSTKEWVMPTPEKLDDANYPDHVGPGPLRGTIGDNINPRTQPAYAGTDETTELVYAAGPHMSYTFITPVQDIGSIPGTDILNIGHGPVTGFAMDAYQTGARVPLSAQPVGLYGPVGRTEPDYATRAAYANFTNAFADYSTAAATHSQIAAI